MFRRIVFRLAWLWDTTEILRARLDLWSVRVTIREVETLLRDMPPGEMRSGTLDILIDLRGNEAALLKFLDRMKDADTE